MREGRTDLRFTLAQLVEMGLEHTDLVQAGYSEEELEEVGCTATRHEEEVVTIARR